MRSSFCSPASSPRRKPPDAICERNACTLKTCTLKTCMPAICCIPMTPGIRTTDRAGDDLASLVLLQPPELKTRQLDGFFYSRPREPVRRVLIGPERTLGAPGPVVLRQLASGRNHRQMRANWRSLPIRTCKSALKVSFREPVTAGRRAPLSRRRTRRVPHMNSCPLAKRGICDRPASPCTVREGALAAVQGWVSGRGSLLQPAPFVDRY